MEVTHLKLSQLKHPERNVRRHTQKQIAELQRSLSQFGQTRAIVVDENYEVLIGNGLMEAMLAAGYEEAAVYMKTGLTANEKKKLMIADNKTYQLGIDDLQTLDDFLNELGLDEDLDIPGFELDMLNELIGTPEDITEEINNYGTLSQQEIDATKAAGERMEADPGFVGTEYQPVQVQTEAAAAPAQGNQNGANTAGYTADLTGGEQMEKADTQRFVICPHCGMKIWL